MRAPHPHPLIALGKPGGDDGDHAAVSRITASACKDRMRGEGGALDL